MSLDLDKLLGEETVSEADSKEIKETATTLPVEKPEKKAPTTTKKKKGKPRGGNSPVIGTNGLNLEPGDNTKFLNINLELMNMPSIDMENAEEVQKRLSEYFELYGRYDVKPTVVGMAIALNGHSRQWLWAVKSKRRSSNEKVEKRWFRRFHYYSVRHSRFTGKSNCKEICG